MRSSLVEFSKMAFASLTKLVPSCLGIQIASGNKRRERAISIVSNVLTLTSWLHT